MVERERPRLDIPKTNGSKPAIPERKAEKAKKHINRSGKKIRKKS